MITRCKRGIRMQLRPLALWVASGSLVFAQSTSSPPPSPANLLADVAGRPAMRLDEFQKIALASNPTLRQAAAHTAQSAAQAQQAALYPNPSVGYQGEQIRGGSYHGGEQGAFIQQTFPLGGKLGLRRNVYEQQRRADETSQTEQRYRVLGSVGRSFYAALAAQEVVNVRKQLLGIATDAAATAHQLANVGQADAPDVLQAEVEGEQAELDYLTAQRVFLQEFRSLAAVSGQPDLPVSPLAGDFEHPPHLDTEHLINEIVHDSPTVHRAQQEIARSEAELKSARREVVPDLQLHAGLQQNFEPLNGGMGTAVGLQGFATAGIALPLFNRNQGNVAAAQAAVEQARADVSRVEFSLRQSALPLVQEYLTSAAEAERYRNEMIPRARRAYQLYLASYRQMAAAYPQVIVSQRTLFQLQVGYINALHSQWNAAVGLQNYALVSGLDPPTPATPLSSTGLNLPGVAAGMQ